MNMESIKQRISRPSPVSLILFFVLALVIVLTVVLAKIKPTPEEVEDIPEQAAAVKTVTVKPASIRDIVTLPGRVKAESVTTLAAEKNGRVVNLLVDRGDSVKEGQLLMQIDDRHWKILDAQAKVELANAERDLKRWEKLKQEGAIPESEYDAIKRRFDLAKIARDEAEVHLAQCQVKSATDGVVDARYVDLGDYVVEGKPVMKIVNTSGLNVWLNIPERDVVAVSKGTKLIMRCSALAGAVVTGRVDFVAEAGTPELNSFKTEAEILQPPHGLKPGMLVDVEVSRGDLEDAIVVPAASVLPKRGEHVVFVVDDGRAILRVVQMGAFVGSDVILLSGLDAGEQLVVEGHRTLQDGVPVEMISAADGTQE
jgi:membrane fusion protein (multidrug efflux system)